MLGAGIAPEDLIVVAGKPTVQLQILGTGDRIDLGVGPDPDMALREVRFATGEVWTAQMLVDMALAATEGDDVIFGTDGVEVLDGLGGDDRLITLDGADDLAGGAGVDLLEGGLGNDTYRFGLGDDQDRIVDAGGDLDVLVLGAGITVDDIRVAQSSDGSAIILAVGSDGDRIRIDNALGDGKIEALRFDDGTEWGLSDLLARVPTELDDFIFGDETDNPLEGGGGDDRVSGGAGNDAYRFTAGDGRDILREDAASLADTLVIAGYTAADLRFVRLGTDSTDMAIQFVGSNDQIIIVDGLSTTGRGIETITLEDDGTVFTPTSIAALLVDAQVTDGNDIVVGTDGDDALTGGPGNDLLVGLDGDDTYRYAAGDGDDRIDALGRGTSEVVLSDYTPDDVASAVRAGPGSDDLVVTFVNAGDRIVLVDALGRDNDGTPGTLTLRFSDDTVWDRADMRAQAVIDVQTGGDDNIFGFDGDDLIDLTPGDDFASGAAGSDRYVFSLGDGHDRIEDAVANVGDVDVVDLVGFDPAEATVSRLFRGSETVLIEFAGNEADSLMLIDALAEDGRGVEQLVFDTGEIWTRETLEMLLDNNAPVANEDGFFAVTTGLELVIALEDLLANDFDADNDALRVVSVDGSPDGVAALGGDGTVRFTSLEGFTGATTLSYLITDDRNAFAEAVVNVNVRPVAEARDDDGFEVAEDEFLSIRVERLLSNDVDGDRMIVGQVFDAIGGTVALSSDGNIGFTPDANYVGPAQFSYAANTPEGGRAEAVVYIDVTPVNDAPVARADRGLITDEGEAFTIGAAALADNDTDIDGDVLTVTEVQSSADIFVSLDQDGIVQITPRDDFFGEGTFTYTVADPDGATAIGTVTVTVRPVNDAPVATDDLFELTQAGDPILEDNPIILSAARLTENDIDADGDAIFLLGVREAIGGRATLLDNQTVLFEPNGDFNGEARFTYTVDDGQGGRDSAVATIVYQPVNDRPVARNDRYTDDDLVNVLIGREDEVLTIPIIELLKNDFDVEGFSVNFENATGAVNGDLVVEDGNIIFTPDPDFFGEATFGYSVTDPEGLVDGAMVTMFFEGVSDVPPVAVADQFLIPEDIPTVIRFDTLLGNDTDADGDTLSVVGWRPLNGLGDAFKFGGDAAGPLNGTLEFNADGDLLYTPFIDANFTSGFVYLLSDNAGGTAEGFVDLVIIPSNDDPTTLDDPGFVTPFEVPLVIRAADLVFNDFDIEQADNDLDGTRDDDLDDPDRDRPTFVGVDALYDPLELAQGNRVEVGSFEIVEFRGEEFLVARFEPGFTGPVTIQYRIADEEGLEDVGFAYATVADFYGQELSGTPLIDYIEGNELDETIRGYRRDDWVVAKGGNDLIETGLGADLIEAGDGDDIIDAGDDGDDIRGGDGFDTVRFGDSNTGVRADLSTLIGQGGFAQGDLYVDIEAFEGTAFSDTLGGDDSVNRLAGLGGNDELEGRGADDTLEGGDGDDLLDGGAGGDIKDGGDGTDTATYFFSDAGVQVSLANGTATGGWAEGDTLISIENLIGTEFADTLEGNDQNNVLDGGGADDTLIGGEGDDHLTGGRGADDLQGGGGEDTISYTFSNDGILIDLASNTASGGDAEGDMISGIEIIEASYQDDILRGDDQDNRFRGSRGADEMDGRGGFDTADYTTADEAVTVDLALGQGLAGEALGDTLISIEQVLGSVHDDTIIGTTGRQVFDGRFGNDLLQGGAGSDQYLFGFDSAEDTITEIGDAADVDQLILRDGLLPKDVSVIRQGDDLFIEFERDDGFLIDTVTVTDHFLGRETGIEEIVFTDGTIWDRATIEDQLRLGRFNAADDIFRLGVEDELVTIDPAELIRNDAEVGVEDLELISVQGAEKGAVSINADGMIEFLGAQDHFGDAFFTYTVRDPSGRESTARVEVNLAPVNDAPVANDDPLVYGVEDEPLRIRLENLLANDYDVDGDNEMEGLRIVSATPLFSIDGEPLRPYKDNDYDGEATDATWKLSGQYIELLSRPDHFGFAGFRYVLEDNDGAQDTADVEIYFAPVNDAPRIRERAVSAKLEEVTTFSVDQLMSKVYDIEGDTFEFVGLHIGADGNATSNGFEVFDANTGLIDFTPFQLGKASIAFDVIDARGAEATLEFNIEVRPQNLAPNARNDYGLRALEDETITIDPAFLLENDTDPDGDTLFFESVYRFAENGKVRVNDDGMIEFAVRPNYNGQASFEYTINDGRGLTDTAIAYITVLPRNSGPELRNDVVNGLEDGPQYVIPAEAFGNDRDVDGDVIFFQETVLLGNLAYRFLSSDYTVEAKSANNGDLPDWLFFDAATMTFSGTFPEDGDPVEVAVFLTDPSNGAVHAFRFSYEIGDKEDLEAGLSVEGDVLGGFRLREAYDWSVAPNGDDVATFDIADGSFDASVIGGRPLPAWLRFDAETRELVLTGFEPDEGEDVSRVQIVYTPGDRPDLPEDEYYATEQGFTVEFVIDPVAPNLDAINAILAGDPALEAQGLFGVDLSAAASLTSTRESGAPLNPWLSFDPDTLSFSGTPPSQYVGAVPVRIDVEGAGDLPSLSIITEAVVDETFVIDPDNSGGISVLDLPERIDLTTPDDYNGSVAFFYDANDEKGGESEEPGLIVFNVLPERERPDAGTDQFDLFENGSVTFSVAELLDNDRDDDGDAMRVLEIGSPGNGAVSVTLGTVAVATPTTLAALAGGTWTATLDDGSDLPDWIMVDAATGALNATVPLDMLGDLAITFTNSDGISSQSETATFSFDGNADATVTYLPTSGFAGQDILTYTLTDDAEGTTDGTILLDVASLLDPPIAVTDTVDVLEDGFVVIDPADLLANDRDVDGDAIRFVDVQQGSNGVVTFDGTDIVFTPIRDFNGGATFTYTVTDDTHGTSVGLVEVNVINTNRAPEAVTDVFQTVEDVPFEFTIDDLLANDTDLDGDEISFTSLQTSVDGGRLLELPDGRYQFVPDENLFGELSFSYSITDGRLSDRGTITFDIEAVNDAPIANPDGLFLGDQDTPFAIDFADLLFNDRDVEGDNFRLVEVFDGDNGTVFQDGETAVFQGRDGYFGDGGFNYRVTDDLGATSIGYASVLVLPLFDVPVAVSDAGYEMLEDSFIDIDPLDLMANDDIPLGSEVIFLGLTGPGVTELESGLYRVTAEPDFFGTLTLRYALTNETGFEVPTTVTIEVLPVADGPVAVDDSLTLNEDQPLTIFTSTLTDNDFDVDREAIVLTRILDTDGVTVEILGNGQMVITPLANVTGDASFTYELKDSSGAVDTANVAILIGSDNDAPVIGEIGVLDGTEDAPFTVNFAPDLVTDADGDVLVVELRAAGGDPLPEWLEYDAETRTVTGTPPENFNGDVLLELAAFDGRVETVAEVTVRIAPVNDAPVAEDDLFEVQEDNLLEGAVLPNDSDVDGDALTVTVDTDVANGDLLLREDGTFEYLPNANFFGTDSFTYIVSDGDLSDSSTVTLTINGVNDAPVAADDALVTDEDTALSGSVLADNGAGADADVDLGDVLQVTEVNGASAAVGSGITLASGAVLTLNADGSFDYDPNGQFETLGVGETDTDSFTYTLSDGNAGTDTATANITINGVNDAPELAGTGPFDVLENTTDVGVITATDVEGDGLTYAIIGGADETLFKIDPTSGSLRFLSAPDFESPGSADGDNSYEVQVAVFDGRDTDDAFVFVDVLDEDEGGGLNVVLGTEDSDTLTGSDGDDLIVSDGGPFDVLVGLGGADVFQIGNVEGNGMELAMIADYEVGVDTIDLGGAEVLSSITTNGATYLYLNYTDFDIVIVQGATSVGDITFV